MIKTDTTGSGAIASISKERQGDTHTVFPGLPEETLRLPAANTQVYCISKQVVSPLARNGSASYIHGLLKKN